MGSKDDILVNTGALGEPPAPADQPGIEAEHKAHAERVEMERLQELLLMRRRDIKAAFGRKKWREKKATQTFGTLLNLFFKDRPEILRKVDENSALLSWKEVVGETAAAFSEATRLRGHTLVVRVKDAIWMQQLSLLKTTIVRLYQKKYPQLGIKDIYFTRS